MSKNIVIAGAGIAGLNAAKAARDTDPDCRIVLIDAAEHNTYSRTRLPEYISGGIGKKDLFPYSDEWYHKNNIKLLRNLKITGIEAAAKTINTVTGSISYDSLIIATGSKSNVPPIPGADKQNVITVRTIEDADKVRQLGGKGTTCTIIGGGLLGLEMAWAVKQLGCCVNVVEFSQRLLPRQVDEQGAGLLLDAITKKGMNIYLNSQTKEIYGGDRAQGVRLADGTELPSDFVILSTGVTANTSPFSDSGIKLGRAVQVNSYLETSIAGIYAAGDAAEFEGKNFSIWPIAIAQGKIAGINAAGERTEYKELQPFTHLKIKGITMFSIGDIACTDCITASEFDEENGRYVKLFIKNNTITAAIVFGDPSITMKIKNAVEEKALLHTDKAHISEIISRL